MNELQIFNNTEFGEIRVLETEGEVWFVGKEIAEVLGYKNTRDAISKHIDNEDKKTLKFRDCRETRLSNLWKEGDFTNKVIINESGLYSLILSSKLPTAKNFKRWVTSEVLPQIRKTGGYIPIKENETELEIVSKALLIVNKTLEEKEKLLKEQKPLVDFANQISASEGSVEIGEFAKMINDNENIKIGRNRLFDWLRKNGYLMKNNIPYQRYIKNNYFEVIEKPVPRFDGLDTINKQTLITGKGQIKVLNKLKQSNLR